MDSKNHEIARDWPTHTFVSCINISARLCKHAFNIGLEAEIITGVSTSRRFGRNGPSRLVIGIFDYYKKARCFTPSVVGIDLLCCEGVVVAKVCRHSLLIFEIEPWSQQSLLSTEHENLRNLRCRLGQQS